MQSQRWAKSDETHNKGKKMNVLCTICARGGSKGLKNKNILKINGIELIGYSILQAQNSKLFKHIVISTDSDDIAKVAQKYGGEVFFKREAHLASDTAAKMPAMRDALLKSEAHYGCKFDVIVDLDASAPLRSSKDIKAAFELFMQSKKENLITAVHSRRNPYFNLIEVFADGEINTAKPYSSTTRQNAPQCYDMNASIYIFTRKRLLENDDVFGKNTALYVMSEDTAFDVDSELDFTLVEFLIKSKNLQPKDF